MKAYSKLRKMYKKAWYAHLYGAHCTFDWLFYLELKTYDKPLVVQD